MFRRKLISLTVLSAISLALPGCGEPAGDDPRTEVPLVRTAMVQQAAAPSRTFSGIVAARIQSDQGFRVAGKVLQRLVDTGQSVRRGQPLMRLDPVDLQLAAHAQREAVAAARARAEQTALDEARFRDLQGTGAVSASAYDQAKAAADAAMAQLRAAEAQAEVAINASHYAELLADADGIVIETLAEPGQVVSAGQPVVRLAHAGPREAIIQLPETLRPELGSVGEATLFGNADASAGSYLRQRSDAADPLTRTFEARYVLDGALADAPLGATVSIRITGEQLLQHSVQIPIGALYDQGKGPGVWVIRGEPATVSWQAVQLQQLNDDSAYVSGQLQLGERIVALGAHLLREGTAVRFADTVATAGTGAQP